MEAGGGGSPVSWIFFFVSHSVPVDYKQQGESVKLQGI